MVKIGMMIGDRYEILEKIGTGGMSDVYKAKCHKLNRYVAVKILKQEFSENANFVSKFRTEAQAAAGLMHPNIVNVYDVGEEDGIYYIVMELVEGLTLKKYIEKKARLSYKEAVSIAIQVSMGIEAAHKNHIIHRDIKPQNIIISRDGKVKVTDFGIAKAATSNTITSNVMGSVHYTSPEQARGGYSDEKSDIYSLGITLFEMLTGRVPFNGETTVAIAIKQIQEEMPYPTDFVPEIPLSVEQIVMKCCQKSPDRRYQNVGALIEDLKKSLIDPDGGIVEDNLVDGGTREMTDREMAQIKHQTRRDREVYHEDQEDIMRLNEDARDYEEEDEGDPVEDGDDYDYDPRMERVTTVLAVLAGVVICGIIIFVMVRFFDLFSNDKEKDRGNPIIDTSVEESVPGKESTPAGGESGPDEENLVEMPSVVNWNEGDARSLLQDRGLYVSIEEEYSEEVGEGLVIRTDIEGGTMVEKGTTVTLTVSLGRGMVPVPGMAGMLYEDAYVELTNMGFVVQKNESFDDNVPEGYVIGQSPEEGTQLMEGAEVVVLVSLGPQNQQVEVPDVTWIGVDEARATLEGMGFVVASVSEVYNAEVPAGLVCYQSYSAGSFVEAGTAFSLNVSLGPEIVPEAPPEEANPNPEGQPQEGQEGQPQEGQAQEGQNP